MCQSCFIHCFMGRCLKISRLYMTRQDIYYLTYLTHLMLSLGGLPILSWLINLLHIKKVFEKLKLTELYTHLTWLCGVVLKTVLHICHTRTASLRPSCSRSPSSSPWSAISWWWRWTQCQYLWKNWKKMQMTGAGEGLSILESVDGQKWKNDFSSFYEQS